MNFIVSFTAGLYGALLCAAAWAAPGAHGPDGEHLDTPGAAVGSAASLPRLEAKSDQFELVASLSGAELSILLDRYETNEPLLNARVDVESGALKASAKFHADHGSYAVDEPAFVEALKKPGAHALVFTVIAGKESDLLDGTLNVATAMTADDGHAHGPQDGHAHAHGDWRRPAALIGVLSAFALGGWWWQRRSRRAQKGGAQ